MTYAEASAGLDYALRAMLALAEAHPERIKGLDLAYRYGLPHKFLGNLLAGARRAGLVQGRSGADGGYRLTRPASTMTLAEVIRAIDGPLTAVRGEPIDRVAYTGPAQHLGDVWAAVETTLCSLLESVTLADVLAGNVRQPLVNHAAVQPLRIPPEMDTATESI